MSSAPNYSEKRRIYHLLGNPAGCAVYLLALLALGGDLPGAIQNAVWNAVVARHLHHQRGAAATAGYRRRKSGPRQVRRRDKSFHIWTFAYIDPVVCMCARQMGAWVREYEGKYDSW